MRFGHMFLTRIFVLVYFLHYFMLYDDALRDRKRNCLCRFSFYDHYEILISRAERRRCMILFDCAWILQA